jgi:hypothetical protein
MSRIHRLAPILLLTSLAVLGVDRSISAQARAGSERFTAFAIDMTGLGSTRTSTVEIVVSRWSTESEQTRLTELLLDKGATALLDVLRGLPAAGYLRTPATLGYDLHFAREFPGEDGGRRIILATDRPIGFWEASHQPRSIDYPFTLIELRLNRDGEGEGKMSIATKIIGDREKNLIELEDYASQPVRLMNVRSERSTTFDPR